MKYSHNSTLHKQWDIGAVKRYMDSILVTPIRKILTPNYCIGRNTLLKIVVKLRVIKGSILIILNVQGCK